MSDDWAETAAKAAFERRAEAGEWDEAFRLGEAGVEYGDSARAMFMFLAEMMRVNFDPAERWEEFIEHLWASVDSAFGLTPPTEEEAALLDVAEETLEARLRARDEPQR